MSWDWLPVASICLNILVLAVQSVLFKLFHDTLDTALRQERAAASPPDRSSDALLTEIRDELAQIREQATQSNSTAELYEDLLRSAETTIEELRGRPAPLDPVILGKFEGFKTSFDYSGGRIVLPPLGVKPGSIAGIDDGIPPSGAEGLMATPPQSVQVTVGHSELLPGLHPAARLVSMLFATNRAKTSGEWLGFTGEDAGRLTYGSAVVRIPEKHALGKIELPFRIGWLGIELPTRESDHFVVKRLAELDRNDFQTLVRDAGRKDIFVFVHGFRTEFKDAVLHFAQIAFDLQCRNAVPILFSWPSRGQLAEYVYDHESSTGSRRFFLEFLNTLRIAMSDGQAARIHVLAHSMGNQLVLEALAGDTSQTNIIEMMMAAPDVNRNRFKEIAPKVRAMVKGMTVYASSVDRALALSKQVAGGIPRAGDTDGEGPVQVENVDVIDVSALGGELLGVNHALFGEKASIINDLQRLITTGQRPPDERLPEIQRVPFGSAAPTHWRYVPR
jgi:esterase/lipase superfamily enzyme